MINVLPPQTKRQLRAAKTNVWLLRYTALSAMALAFLAVAVLSIYFVMQMVNQNAENTISENHSKISNYSAVQSAATEFRSNLATAKSIFDGEVVYSDTVIAIAQTIPPGVILDNLNLDANSFGKPITLTARAKSYDRAIAMKDALENSQLFSEVHFADITTMQTTADAADPASAQLSDYPYAVNMNVTLNKPVAAN